MEVAGVRASRMAFFVFAFVCVVVIVVFWWFRCGSTTTLLIIRHADRILNQDGLSAAGVARAQELIHVAEKAGLTAIYHSDTIRARQTAQPLAAAIGLTTVEMSANDTDALVNSIFSNHRGQTVLVVGHSNTVPQIIATAGGPTIPDLADDEFDNLFVLSVCACRRGTAKSVNLQYGAASP